MSGHAEVALELITLDELTRRVGLSVRNIRFYTTKGLVPPPIRRGRSGYYSADHVARLELVRELQAHGFTLSAIEKYVADHPERLPLLAQMAENAELATRAAAEAAIRACAYVV